ncbi:MAG TPA: hypothetical protein VGI90_12250 [Steroidobacteraceae bacterium]|jgi:hypothetical protein
MRAILKQALYLSIALVGLYSILLALSYAIVPGANETDGLNSSLAEESIFTTDPKYVFLNRAAVRPDASRVVFVGASNTAVGFKQREVQQLVPSSEVDNLSVGGSNMTQVAQIVDLVQDLQDAAARRRTTFVIGMWYGMFVPDAFRWATPDRHKGDTDIDIERYRYGFYRRSDTGPRQLLPSEELSLGVMLIHPYLVFDDLSRLASKGLRERLSGKPPRRTDEQRNASVVSEAERVFALNYWRDQMHSDGPIAEEQFSVLSNLIARILAQGSKAVLIDLPIPHWHAQRSPFYSSYLERKKALLSVLEGKPGYSFLEMAGQNEDLDFSDEVHPKPRVTPLWAAQAAALLQGPHT